MLAHDGADFASFRLEDLPHFCGLTSPGARSPLYAHAHPRAGISTPLRMTGLPRFRRFRDSSSDPCPCRPILFFYRTAVHDGQIGSKG